MPTPYSFNVISPAAFPRHFFFFPPVRTLGTRSDYRHNDLGTSVHDKLGEQEPKVLICVAFKSLCLTVATQINIG